MWRKVIGAILVVFGALLAGLIISGGTLLPHILGPAILITLGILLIILKQRGKQKQ